MWTRIDQPLAVPAEVRMILTRLVQAGHEAYLVGGCVRDFLRGEVVHDYDLATSAIPDEIEALFPEAIAIGRAFGVMQVQRYEIATFRSESDYSDHRHPKKVKFCGLEGDAKRRDFSINALYYDLKTQKVFDAHSGLEDLQKKQIRAIGNPEERFQEDALRLLRAVRFSTRFGFLIEEKTREAIQKKSPLIRKVSIERIRDELEKMIRSVRVRDAILELESAGLLENVLPEISVAKMAQPKVWEQTLRAAQALGNGGDHRKEPISFFWGMLLTPTFRILPIEQRENASIEFSKRMKFSVETMEQIAYLVRETAKFREAFSMREAKLLRWMREDHFELLMRFHLIEARSFDGNLAGLEFVRSIYPEAKRRFEVKPMITGDDLLKLGLQPSRQFSEILRTVEDLVLEGELTTQTEALEYVLKHYVR